MITSRIIDASLRIRASYWFLPGLLAVGSILMAAVLVRVDIALGDEWLSDYEWLRVNQAEGARALLSTVAGSMITVAGVTFSLMLLAVSHATSQIGPHLLGAFMRDRGNQITLGTFIATFLYCVTLLRSVHGGTADAVDSVPFIPHLAVNGALALAGLSVTVLIYFIHHVPQSINVTNVVARVGDDLIRSIDQLYPTETSRQTRVTSAPVSNGDPLPKTLCLDSSGGYLRVTHYDTLMAVARDCDTVITVIKRPGDFALRGEALLYVRDGDRIDDEHEMALRTAFTWGAERTANQDVLMPVQQLLEIVGRALSPGVNNQYTAVLAINQLARGLRELLGRPVPESGQTDEAGTVRVVVDPVGHEEFLRALLAPLHQYVDGDWVATSQVIDRLECLAKLPELRAFESTLRDAAKEFSLPALGTERK